MDPALRTLLASQRHVVTAAQAGGLGIAAAQLRQLARAGELIRVGRGGYADGDAFRRASPEEQHLLRCRASLRALGEGFALSHHCAALAWGLPWVGRVPSRVHLARTSRGQGRSAASRTIHQWMPGVAVHQREGMPVVECAYSLLGVAHLHGLRPTLIALDAALRSGGVTIDRLEAVPDQCGTWPGHRVLAAAVPLADPRAESPGETATRLVLSHLGIAVDAQVEIRVRDVGFAARVDFMLVGHRVIVEFDGLTKYATPGGTPAPQALIREKSREEQLRSLGFEVVRLTWSDLDDPERVRSLIEAACTRAARGAVHRGGARGA